MSFTQLTRFKSTNFQRDDQGRKTGEDTALSRCGGAGAVDPFASETLALQWRPRATCPSPVRSARWFLAETRWRWTLKVS
jgi:hypothetical protein